MCVIITMLCGDCCRVCELRLTLRLLWRVGGTRHGTFTLLRKQCAGRHKRCHKLVWRLHAMEACGSDWPRAPFDLLFLCYVLVHI
jgi:hypothetical protein